MSTGGDSAYEYSSSQCVLCASRSHYSKSSTETHGYIDRTLHVYEYVHTRMCNTATQYINLLLLVNYYCTRPSSLTVN